MKRYLLILLTVFFIALSSCQKWEKPVTPKAITILSVPQTGGESALEGTRGVTISATADWTATSDKGWLYVTPSSGKKGIQEVTIHFKKNTTKEQRMGTITFTCGSRSQTYTLTQNS